jgi:nucleoside-diphosphate-sugar epimerase
VSGADASEGGTAAAPKTVLVTGGAGSVGREVTLLLAARGHRVRVFDLAGCDFSALEGAAEIVAGDVTDPRAVRAAAAGVDAALHLAALLPPNSERDRGVTMAVNVGGTENLVAALSQVNPDAHLVLSSSVCVYGDTSAQQPPVRVTAPYQAVDVYAESKIEAERCVTAGPLPYTVLRISGIAVPAFLAPPPAWPFQADQRIEFVSRDDVVAALAACVELTPARRMLNVAGGPTWRVRGREYVARFNEVMGLPPEEGTYIERPGYFDWYDTEEAQALLGYQQTPFDGYLAKLDAAIEAALAA